MFNKSVYSLDEMIASGQSEARQQLSRNYYFSASVFTSDDGSGIVLCIDGNYFNLSKSGLPAGMSVEKAIWFVAEKIQDTDNRTAITADGNYLKIELPDSAYLQMVEEHYRTISKEEIRQLCREKIFVKHYSYVRPYKIEVNKDGILSGWGNVGHVSPETVYKFGLFSKLKHPEQVYYICSVINEYSGYKYEYANLFSDGKYKYGEASVLTIKAQADLFD